MARSHGSVRIGPTSIIILAVAICLAVMAMLAVATTQSVHASAQRQAQFTTDTYLNESVAQEFLAGVSEAGDISDAENALPTLIRNAQARGVSVETTMSGDTLTAVFTADSGRSLQVTLEFDSGDYRITEWMSSTVWEVDDSEKLWGGM